MSLGAYLLRMPILAYRWLISPWLGPRCRYLPTCSVYALDALAQHGAIKGGWLAIHRICRCHPFGGHGFDPVPTKEPSHPDRITSKEMLFKDDRSSQMTDRRTGIGSWTSF